jgi:alpha-amylase
MLKAKLLTVFVCAVLALSGCTTPEPRSDVGIQLFMFNWESVALECEEVLGPAGIDWVLVSPPQEHLDDAAWWVHYQPVSYKIESRLGTRQQFESMVKTCERSGVKVVVDAVINHMAGRLAGFGWTGTTFEKYNYQDLYTKEDFHKCNLTSSGQIENYFDRDQVQTCELLGLSDLSTGSIQVREKILGYLNDLLALGVSGFRIDAAKHISHEDLRQIIGQLPAETMILHEVIRGGGEPINPVEYIETGLVWEFRFATTMRDSMLTQWSPDLPLDSDADEFLPGEFAVSFVSNHDTERNGKSLAAQNDPALFELATLYMLASDYGTPMLYSGYVFDDFDMPPALSADGLVAAVNCSQSVALNAGDWFCQHRSETVKAMLTWRIAVAKSLVTSIYWSESVTGWSRGKSGFFAMNVSDVDVEVEIPTDLPTGTYCNTLASECEEFEVSGSGKIKAVLKPRSAIALLG